MTILRCPKNGSTYYLDSIVETVAGKLGADLIRFDAQDIALTIDPRLQSHVSSRFWKKSLSPGICK